MEKRSYKKPTNTSTKSKINSFISKSDNKNGHVIYIGNLNYKRDEVGVKFLFSRYGKVQSVNMQLKPGTELKKGTAFVHMPNKEEALAAVKGLNGAQIDGRTIKASIAKDSSEPEKSFKAKKITDKDFELSFKDKQSFKKEKNKKKRGLDELFDYLQNK